MLLLYGRGRGGTKGTHSHNTRAHFSAHGLRPVAARLARARRDFGPAAYWYYPTLFWISAADWVLYAVPALGAAAGLAAVVGGAWSPCCLAAAWVALLSIDPAATIYPWVRGRAASWQLTAEVTYARPSATVGRLLLPNN